MKSFSQNLKNKMKIRLQRTTFLTTYQILKNKIWTRPISNEDFHNASDFETTFSTTHQILKQKFALFYISNWKIKNLSEFEKNVQSENYVLTHFSPSNQQILHLSGFSKNHDFGMKLSQRVRFSIESFSTCQILNKTIRTCQVSNQLFTQASVFQLNVSESVRFWM